MKIQNTVVLAGLLALLSLSASALESRTITCATPRNQFGGVIGMNLIVQGESLEVSGFANGGEAHWVTGFGPFAATAHASGDEVTYTFHDSSGQIGELTMITTDVGGRLMISGSSNYGLWTPANMICN